MLLKDSEVLRTCLTHKENIYITIVENMFDTHALIVRNTTLPLYKYNNSKYHT
jgi:hypothetical protein